MAEMENPQDQVLLSFRQRRDRAVEMGFFVLGLFILSTQLYWIIYNLYVRREPMLAVTTGTSFVVCTVILCLVVWVWNREVVQMECTREGISVITARGRRERIAWGDVDSFRWRPSLQLAVLSIKGRRPLYARPLLPAAVYPAGGLWMSRFVPILRGHSDARIIGFE